MGNAANQQCPICRSTDIDQKYVTTEPFYHCNKCGERFKWWLERAYGSRCHNANLITVTNKNEFRRTFLQTGWIDQIEVCWWPHRWEWSPCRGSWMVEHPKILLCTRNCRQPSWVERRRKLRSKAWGAQFETWLSFSIYRPNNLLKNYCLGGSFAT